MTSFGISYPQRMSDDEINDFVYEQKYIDEYDGVVYVENPTSDQIILRETYSETTEDGIEIYEVVIYDDGSTYTHKID